MSTEAKPVDLKPFCAEKEDGSRYAIHEPFVRGGYRYATNGRIMVRVPAPGEPDSVSSSTAPLPKLEKVDYFAASDKELKPFPLVSIKPITEACDNCNGSGQCECSCCENIHNCQDCDGNGSHPGFSREFFKVENCVIPGENAYHIAGLPDPIQYLHPIDAYPKPLRFVFAGGEGCVSPCNPDEEAVQDFLKQEAAK